MIPLFRPIMPSFKAIEKYLDRCRETGIYTNFGPLFEEATQRLSRITGRQCLPVNNGTSAIEIACRVAFKKGARILVPDYTHAGTLQGVRAAGCIPIIGETDSETWTLKRITGSLDGAVIVSPFGYNVDVETYDALAEKMNIPLVYDFAGAWGFFPKTKHPVTYSLHATKNFSCGEGGIVAFSRWNEWMDGRSYSNFCTQENRMVNTLDGNNLKASEILCAIILAHLDQPELLTQRLHNKWAAHTNYVSVLGLKSPDPKAVSLCVFELEHDVAKKIDQTKIAIRQYYAPFGPGLIPDESKRINWSRYALPSDIGGQEFWDVCHAIEEARK